MRKESFGDTYLAYLLGMILDIVLFHGDPDISDSLRVAIGKWAGTITEPYEQPKEHIEK